MKDTSAIMAKGGGQQPPHLSLMDDFVRVQLAPFLYDRDALGRVGIVGVLQKVLVVRILFLDLLQRFRIIAIFAEQAVEFGIVLAQHVERGYVNLPNDQDL